MISLFETPKKYMARKCAEAEKRARIESVRARLELAGEALKRVEINARRNGQMSRAFSI